MEKKKLYVLGYGMLIACGTIGICSSLFLNNFNADAINSEDYKIVFNSTKNKISDVDTATTDIKTTDVKTNRGGIVEIEYTNVTKEDNVWQNVAFGSYFRNTTAIRGITSIKLKFSSVPSSEKSFNIYYGDTSNINTSSPCETKICSTSETTINFDTKPFYFMFYLPFSNMDYETTSLNITSFEINYECDSDYKEIYASSDDSSKGEVIGSKGYTKTGSEVKLIANPKNGYKFDYWTKDGVKIVDYNHSYLTYNITDDSIYKAHFTTQDSTWGDTHGATPLLIDSEITYGLWPKTRVTDQTLINSFNSYHLPNDVFFNWDNEYYVSSTCKLFLSPVQSHTFSDSTTAENDAIYYFKCEPILWKILSQDDDTYIVEAKDIIDGRAYGLFYSDQRTQTDYQGDTATVYANNWKYSKLRTYLNTAFFNNAFGHANDKLLETTVTNNGESTLAPHNPYVCENTTDKVYLNSVAELKDRSDEDKQKAVSDYALTHDIFKSDGTTAGYLNNGFYWSRSPSAGGPRTVQGVFPSGESPSQNYYTYVSNGLAPVIRITLKS